MRGEDQRDGRDARAAAGGEGMEGIDVGLGEKMADFLAGPERPVFIIKRSEWQVACARNVARLDARARIGLRTFEAALAAGVEQRGAHLAGKNLLLGHDLAAFLGVESGRSWQRFAAIGW